MNKRRVNSEQYLFLWGEGAVWEVASWWSGASDVPAFRPLVEVVDRAGKFAMLNPPSKGGRRVD